MNNLNKFRIGRLLPMTSFYLVMFLLPAVLIALAAWLVKKESKNNG